MNNMVIIFIYRQKIMIKVVIFFTVALLVACTSRNNAELEEKKELQAIPSVCIWDKITVRQEPFRKAAVICHLNLGEAVTYLGISAVDSTFKNQVYYHIRLSDDRIAWVPAFSLVTNGTPAVVLKETPVYLRPDLLTITDKNLEAMEIVAVIEKSDDWVNFYSEKKLRNGWVRSEALSNNMEDIAFSLFAGRILNEQTNKTLTGKIDSIMNYNLYPNSVFVSVLEDIGEKEKERIRIEEIVKQNLRNPDE
jgi:hypothetical protein